MTKIQKVLMLEITPEQFLDSCSPMELMEIDVLIQSPRYQNKMHEPEGEVVPVFNPLIAENNETDS